MIIAKTEGGKLILGLSRRNIELLVDGYPILKSGLPGLPDFAIIYGETEQEIFEWLERNGLEMPSNIDMPTVNKVPT